MNILCVIESGSWAETHLAGSLRALGHGVTVFRYGPAVGEFYGRARAPERAAKNRALLAQAEALRSGAGLDLVFCYVYDDFLDVDTARALAGLRVPLVNYNVDMLTQWYRQTRTAPYFSLMLCAQRANMDRLARYNPRVLHFPMAGIAPPAPAPAEAAFEPAAPVTFVGTPMPYRTRVLQRLHRAGIPLAVYGKYWQEQRQASAPATREKVLHDVRHYLAPKWRAEGAAGLLAAAGRRVARSGDRAADPLPAALCKGFVPDAALASLFARSAVNLGFTRMTGDDPDRPGATQVKLRDFEVPLAGGFYLVERVAEYEAFFRPGVEVETWASVDELVAKIRHYLDHDEERRRIAEAGRRRATADHTWARRFALLFRTLGLEG